MNCPICNTRYTPTGQPNCWCDLPATPRDLETR